MTFIHNNMFFEPLGGANRQLSSHSHPSSFRHASAAQLRQMLPQLRAETLRRLAPLVQHLGEQLTVPQHPVANLPLWELGHIGWFQAWWIGRNPQRELGRLADPVAPRLPPALPQADSWYDSSRVPHASRWTLPLLDLPQTLEHLEQSLAHTLRLLDQTEATHDTSRADVADRVLYCFRLAWAHEAMHAEALSMLAHHLGCGDQPVLTRYAPGPALTVPATSLRVGLPDSGFTFDNERSALVLGLQAFEIDAHPVTNGQFAEYLAFAGRQAEAEQLAELSALQAVCHVDAADAAACAAWMGRRLPTEHEWMAACQLHGAFPQPDAASSKPFAWGDVWEWTSSTFAPYPEFTPDPYVDYSQPWFGTHIVLKGGSAWALPQFKHAHYRNFFVPHRRDVLSGFRTALSLG